MKVTLKDIAAKLDMNESTVSYALANKGTIKAETRKLVLETAAQLGYVPNRSAQQVSTGRSNQVGLVVPNVLFELGEFCEHTFRLLSDAGYLTSIMVTEFSPERELSIFKNLIGQGVTGIIACPTALRQDLTPEQSPLKLAQLNHIPVICRNVIQEGNCITTDYRASGRLIGKELRRCGRRRISLMIPHPPPFSSFSRDLLDGIAETAGADVSVQMEFPDTGPVSTSQGTYPANPHYEEQMRSILETGFLKATEQLFQRVWSNPRKRPDAMVCLSENTALGMMNAAKKCGCRIPRDLSLVTTQHSLFSNFMPAPVSAVYVSALNFAEGTVKLLLKKIKQKSTKAEHVYLKPEFFPGGTLIP